MASRRMFVIFALFAVSVGADSPISKVITLMNNLEEKIHKEMDATEIAYHEKESWCEDQGVELKHTTELEASKVQALLAQVQKEIAAIEAFEARIAGKGGELTEEEQKLKDALDARNKQHEEFLKHQKDINEVIGALSRTIRILEAEAKSGEETEAEVNQAQSLLQAFSTMVDASLLQSTDAKKLMALLQSAGKDKDESESDDEETSGNLKKRGNRALDLLYDLLDKAKQSLDEANSMEINGRHDYEKLKQQIMEAMGFDQEDIKKATDAKSNAEQSKATDEQELSRYQQLLQVDKKAALELKADCLKAAVDYKSETEDRQSELEALASAIEAMDKTEGATTLTYGKAPEPKAAFLQVGNKNSGFEAVKVVRSLAQETHSTELQRLASRLASLVRHSEKSGSSDPFQKVEGMIMDMVDKLEKEAAREATQKTYCDNEMSRTMSKKADKDDKAEKLQVRLDDYSAKQVSLQQDLADLQQELAEMTQSQKQEDSIRQEESNLYKKSKSEMEDGLNGVKIALKVLRKHYEAEGAGVSDAGKGIIGLLEVVESDFSKTIATLTADETGKEQAYTQDKKENNIVMKEKQVTVKYKQEAIADLDNKIAEKTSDHDGVQTEIGAILEYQKHLESMCVAKPEAYAVRKERREKEIDGLKQALSVLNGGEEDEEDSAFLQQAKSGKQVRFLRH